MIGSKFIRFDITKTVRSNVQSRGRARQSNSKIIIMLERGNTRQREHVCDIIRSENTILESSKKRNPNTCHVKPCDFKETETYFVESTGASVTQDSSVNLIHQYCSKLPADNLSPTTPLIVLSAPPVNEEQMEEVLGITDRKNEQCGIYAAACLELCNEMNIKAIDLFSLIQQREDWLTTSFIFTPAASATVSTAIRQAITDADWVPSLHWDSLPTEFDVPITATACG